MRIALRLAFDEAAAVRLLNWLAVENDLILRGHPNLPWLYTSGVVYKREEGEVWSDYLNLLQQQHEDCDALAAARAGELMARGWRALAPSYLEPTNRELRRARAQVRETGFAAARARRLDHIPAQVFLRTRTKPGVPGLYHCLVRYRIAGRWYEDDPSARLGMYKEE